MIVYFTGTGNSRYCARMLADQLDDEPVDAFHWIRDGIAAELFSEKPWVFVSPTYGWRLPRVFSDFIRSGSFSGSRDAYFVMTCGSEIGHAARYNQKLCSETGFLSRGTFQVVMPENYIALFSAPEEKEARTIVLAAHPPLEQAAALIRTHADFPAPKVGLADRLKSGPVNEAFYRFVISDRHFTVSDRCIACGRCETVCPLGNIQQKDGKPVWGGRCTHCMACICGCPTEAIEYGKASKGKPRYQCPAYARHTGRSD